MKEVNQLNKGNLGLIQETDDGKIIQIGLTEQQSKLLQIFMAEISKDSPLIQMDEDFELTFKK